MRNQPRHPDSSGEHDSWERLAKDLFGIDFAKNRDVESPPQSEDVPTDDRDRPAAVDREQDASDGESEVAEPADTDDAPVSAQEAHSIEEVAADPTADVDQVTQDSEDGPAREERKDDTYWDALNDWRWDDNDTETKPAAIDATSDVRGSQRESSSGPATAEPSREPPCIDASLASDDYSSPADLREEYIDDADFGAGLFDERSSLTGDEQQASSEPDADTVDSATPDQTSVAPTESAEESPVEPRKRRRRRRRRRSGDSETATPPEEAEPADVVSDAVEAEDLPLDQPVDEAARAAQEDVASKPKRSSRRRSRSPRRQSPAATTADEQPEEDEDAQVPTGEADDLPSESSQPADDEDADADTPREGNSPYRNVPTWEEAISYVLSQKPAQAHSADSESATPSKAKTGHTKGDSPKSSGRRGRRRR